MDNYFFKIQSFGGRILLSAVLVDTLMRMRISFYKSEKKFTHAIQKANFFKICAKSAKSERMR